MEHCKLIKSIFNNNDLQANKIEKVNIGFNSSVYSIDNDFIIKLCTRNEREECFSKEISFYNKNSYDFITELVSYDLSKTTYPYFYSIQKQIKGKCLYQVWGELNSNEKKSVLSQLLNIMKTFHSQKVQQDDYTHTIDDEYTEYLQRLTNNNVLTDLQIEYLLALKESILTKFQTQKLSFIHGDLQFNNVILTDDGQIKIIDFEHYEIAPVEKEFAALDRMINYPESFMQKGNKCDINGLDFEIIREFFKSNYPEVCSSEIFDKNLLTFDILNSLYWLNKFPHFPRYNETLFEKSKILIK